MPNEKTVADDHGQEVALRSHIFEIYAGSQKDLGSVSTEAIVADINAIYNWVKTGVDPFEETEETETDD